MGHASIKLTADTYGHPYPSMQREAADRIQELLTKARSETNPVALLHPLLHGDDADSQKAI
jgi:hypothetical protein